MVVRLIWAIVSTLFEETALVVIVFFGLPRLGIYIPLPGLIALMVVWLAVSAVIYQIGSRALRRKQLVGLPDMIGSWGRVVTTLAPEGLVKIRGELWVARSASGEMEPGEGVIVVGQDSLKLIVRSSSTADLERAE